MLVFTQDIEKVLIEQFSNAKKSITIVVAWFTNHNLINSLISVKRYSNIEIQILVDDNTINQKYFFDKHKEDLNNVGIKIRTQTIRNFNHNKFSIIDNKIIITGSYNYTIKANRNLENIVILEDENIATYFNRIFNFLQSKIISMKMLNCSLKILNLLIK